MIGVTGGAGGEAGMGLSSDFGLIGFGRATGVGLEEVGECALVVEVQAERNLADILVRRAQQRAGFFKGEVVQIVIDAVAGEFSHYSAEIGGRDVQFVGIETDLSLRAEIFVSKGEEYLQDVLLVAEVGRDEPTVEGQFADKEQTDVDERVEHFLFIYMCVVDGVLNLFQYAS